MNKTIKESLLFFITFLLANILFRKIQGTSNLANSLLASITAGIFYGALRGILLHYQSK
ncbi:MAG TPA: hypothetical protein VK118_03185 [Tetragenococcus sp.]|nr:hypothetical protein [Tetragenococcus sp.]